MVNITKFAIKRPITIILCLITVAYFGIQTLMGSKVELTPDMELPVLVIGTVYAGASPEDINDLIISKQEDAISSLDSVDTVHAYSQENVAIVMVQYEFGTNIDTAYINLKKAIDGIRSDMPDDIEEPNILEVDMNAQPVVTLSVSGNVDGNLYTYVDENIIPEIEKLSSVGEVSSSGGQKSYVRVELIPDKMEQYHLNMETVGKLVGAADFTIPAGDINVGKQKLDVSIGNDYDSTESLKDIAIPLADGDTIHLSDIANVYDSLEEKDTIGRYNGQDIISLEIKKQQSSTEIEVSKQVLEKINELEASFPALDFTVIDDSSEMIENSISDVFQTVFLAILLSMIVLWLFCGDLRASFIIGMSILSSVVLALIGAGAMGFSINVISMTSLVFGVGMMVDNSINILDGCFRAKEKLNYYDAAIEGSRTMIGAIAGGTMTNCVVFVPLLMLTGLTGQLFVQLAYTIIFCLTASLFSAVTIVPLCFYKWHPRESEKAVVSGLIKSMQNWYRSHMPQAIPRTKRVFGTTVILMVLALMMAGRLSTDLMPSVDEGIVIMTVKTRPGLSVDEVNETVADVEELVKSEENLDHYLLTYGSTGLSLDGGNDVTVSAYLKDNRKLSTEEVMQKWRRETEDYKDISITMKMGSSISSSVMTAGDEIEIDLQSTDYDALKSSSDEMVDELRKRTDVMQIHSSIENTAPVVKIKVDPVKAQAEGLTPASIGSYVYSNLSGITASTIRVNGNDIDVKVEYAPDKYNTIDKLQGMMITTGTGTNLPLESLASIRYEDSPQQIVRKNKQYQVAITMQPQAANKKTAEKDVKKFVDEWDFPDLVEPAASSLDEMMNEELGSLGGALFTAIFLLFIVMAIQFESPKYSLMIMVTIPFSLIGAFGLLFAADSPISMVSMLGFLMMIGNVVNNGILYVETVNNMLYEENMALDEALVEAGAIRMRPILMTMAITVISELPNVFAYGESGSLMQGLALVNVGGLLASTALMLLMMPTFYRVVYHLGRKKDIKPLTVE
ncbi:efflux RND transporter permease subunit [Lachnospiraceae bacterium 54-53]